MSANRKPMVVRRNVDPARCIGHLAPGASLLLWALALLAGCASDRSNPAALSSPQTNPGGTLVTVSCTESGPATAAPCQTEANARCAQGGRYAGTIARNALDAPTARAGGMITVETQYQTRYRCLPAAIDPK